MGLDDPDFERKLAINRGLHQPAAGLLAIGHTELLLLICYSPLVPNYDPF